MKKLSYRSHIPEVPTPEKNLSMSFRQDGGQTLSDSPDSATENAGRGGFNLQELSVDIDGVEPDVNDMPSESSSPPPSDLSEVIQALIHLGDYLDQEGEEDFVNLVDMVLSKSASEDIGSFNSILKTINDSEIINQNDALIDITKRYSNAVRRYRLQGASIKDAKSEALSDAAKHLQVMLESNGLTKTSEFWGSNSPGIVAQSLSETIRILVSRMSPQSQPKSIQNIRSKLDMLNPSEMASKRAPGGALIGTSLSLVKNVLNGREPGFITAVLRELSKRL
jgi:hypothetical protein